MQEQLTSREQQIFDLLLAGISPKEIAYKLHISHHTVDFHRTRLYRKRGVQSIQELVATYSTAGAVPAPAAAETVPGAKKRRRLRLLIPAALLAVSVLCTGYFFLKPSGIQAAPVPAPLEPHRISGSIMGWWPNSDAVDQGGNSASNVYISRETIDGAAIDDVINIEIMLAEGSEHPWAQGQTQKAGVIVQLRKADGIRFKARGDGKKWRVQFQTVETPTAGWATYQYVFETIPNQVIAVDIPYTSLDLPPWIKADHLFDFNRERITGLVIEAHYDIQEMGSSVIQIFSFETY